MPTYRSFIDGEWLESASGKIVPNINPADIDEVIGEIQMASRDETRRIIRRTKSPKRNEGWAASC